MTEIRISGVKAARWLRRARQDLDLLLNTGLEDDRHEYLWRIVSATTDNLVLECEETGLRRSLSSTQVAHATIIVPDGHPLIASVEAMIDPAERALEETARALAPHLQGALHNLMDAPLILKAVQQAAAGGLPDHHERMSQASALKTNGQWRLGARIAESWRTAALAAKAPTADIDIDLARFLRAAGEVRSAARVVEAALTDRPPPGAEAVLRRQFAALLADLFERGRRRDPDLLDRAEREARHAYAITMNMASPGRTAQADPEAGALFNRLKSLGEAL